MHQELARYQDGHHVRHVEVDHHQGKPDVLQQPVEVAAEEAFETDEHEQEQLSARVVLVFVAVEVGDGGEEQDLEADNVLLGFLEFPEEAQSEQMAEEVEEEVGGEEQGLAGEKEQHADVTSVDHARLTSS